MTDLTVYPIPNLPQVWESQRQAAKACFPTSNPWAPGNNISDVTKVQADGLHDSYQFQGWIAKQAFWLTATGIGLDRHALECGISRKPPTPGRGKVYVTGQPNAGIYVGAVLIANQDNLVQSGISQPINQNGALEYTVQEAINLDADGNGCVIIEAIGGGSCTNQFPGTELTFGTELINVNGTVTVDESGLGGGADLENDEALRARIANRKQNACGAGNIGDIYGTVSAVPGVSRPFVKPKAFGPGTVGVFFLMEGVYENGIPQPADVAMVQQHVDAQGYFGCIRVCGLRAQPFDVEVKGLYGAGPVVQDQVTSEMQAMVTQRGEPGCPGEDSLICRSWLTAAADRGAGGRCIELCNPTEDLRFGAGYLPVLGSVNFPAS